MKRPRLAALGTTAFRTAAISALVYAVLTGAIVAVVYPLVAAQIQAQIRAGLQAESAALSALEDVRGVETLRDVIRTRSAQVLPAGDNDTDDPGRRYYALATSSGRILAGDLSRWPDGLPDRGWVHLDVAHRSVRALITPLSNGGRLLVGQSLAIPDALGLQAILVVAVGAALALLAGLAGGGVVGIRVMRRLREASATAERIQAGQLGARLPRGGPGEHDVLAGTFNTMLDRIETAVLGLRDMATRTAHEMRHPLARMDQALARAQNARSEADVQTELRTARAEIEELSRRTEALLRLARLESDRERRQFFRELDLTQLVDDVASLYAPSAEDSGRELINRGSGPLPYVGDRQLLAQAIANLLDNAIRYASPEAAISVAVGREGADAVVEVRNVYRDQAPPPDGPTGAGLGLPIARAIAQLHYGRLEQRRTVGEFAARLVLPLQPPAAGR